MGITKEQLINEVEINKKRGYFKEGKAVVLLKKIEESPEEKYPEIKKRIEYDALWNMKRILEKMINKWKKGFSQRKVDLLKQQIYKAKPEDGPVLEQKILKLIRIGEREFGNGFENWLSHYDKKMTKWTRRWSEFEVEEKIDNPDIEKLFERASKCHEKIKKVKKGKISKSQDTRKVEAESDDIQSDVRTKVKYVILNELEKKYGKNTPEYKHKAKLYLGTAFKGKE